MMNAKQMSKYPYITVVGHDPGQSIVYCGKCDWRSIVRHRNALGRTSKAFGAGVKHAKEQHNA